MNDVMQCMPPRLEEAEALAAGRVLYGVEADSARSLGSERDQVWMLLLRGQRVAVLKVSNPAESPETLDMQTEAELLANRLDPALKVAQPRAPLAHIAAGHRARFVARDGQAHWVRCYGVLKGSHHDADVGPLSDAILLEWGAASARLALTLRSFQHAATTRRLQWDVQNAAMLRPLLKHVHDTHVHRLCVEALDVFDTRVACMLPRLRHQIVHGDLNLGNVLLEHGRLSGIIDFGDMSHTALACDIGVMICQLANAHVARGVDEMLRSSYSHISDVSGQIVDAPGVLMLLHTCAHSP